MAEPSPQTQSGSLPEDLRQLWQSIVGQLSTRGAAPAQPAATPSVPVVTANTAQPQQSLLEQLRQRVQEDIAPGPMTANERLSSFGRGVLSNRGSFLDNLSAGLAAQESAQTARRAENLKAAETEGTIAYRDAQARAEEAKQRYLENPNSWQARVAFMKAEADMMQARRPTREPQGSWQLMESEQGPVWVNRNNPTEQRPATGMIMPRDPTITGAYNRDATIEARNDRESMARRLAEAKRAGQDSPERLAQAGIRTDLSAYEDERYRYYMDRSMQSRPDTRRQNAQQSQQQPSPQTQGGEATPPPETQPERVRSNYVPAPAR